MQETDYPVTNAMSSCNRPSQQCSLYDRSVAAQLINKHRGQIQLVNKVNTSHASFFLCVCAPLKTAIHGSGARPARSSQRGKQNFVSKLWPQYHALSTTTTTTTTTTATPQSSILTVFAMKAATNGSSAPENRTLAALVRPAAAASPHDTDLR